MGDKDGSKGSDSDFKKKEEMQKSKKQIALSQKKRLLLFVLIVSIEYAINVSSGVLSSASKSIKKRFTMNDKQFGMFGTAHNIGRMLGCSLFTIMVNTLSRKWMLVNFLFLKSILLCSIMFISNSQILTVVRVFIGIVHMPLTIYVPVWIDQYGLFSYKTILMNILFFVIPLGKVTGYGLHLLVGEDKWMFAFLIEGSYLLFISLCCAITSVNYFSSVLFAKNDNNKNDIELDYIEKEPPKEKKQKRVRKDSIFEEVDTNSTNQKQKSSFISDLCELFHNPQYITVVLFRGVIMGVLSTIHYWIGDYMRTELDIKDNRMVFLAYTLMATGGPLIGILLSWIVRLFVPNYEHKNAGIALVILHLLTSIVGITVPFIYHRYTFSIIVTLFFALSSAALPFVSGAVTTSVTPILKGTGFSIGNFFSMTFTCGPFPWVYGYINDNYGLRYKSISLFVIMTGNFVALLLMLVYIFLKYKRNQKLEQKEEPLVTIKTEN